MARRNAAVASVMTIAVSMSAWGRGSLIRRGSPSSTIGARPAAPPESRMQRLTPLLMTTIPTRTRVRLRSRIR
jgi:hypothetical protein